VAGAFGGRGTLHARGNNTLCRTPLPSTTTPDARPPQRKFSGDGPAAPGSRLPGQQSGGAGRRPPRLGRPATRRPDAAAAPRGSGLLPRWQIPFAGSSLPSNHLLEVNLVNNHTRWPWSRTVLSGWLPTASL